MNNNTPLSKIWWLWFPVVTFIIVVLVEIFLPKEYYGLWVNENGVLETAHGIIMIFGAAFAWKNLRTIDFKTQKFYALWFGVALLGCIYIGGEEVSWGQHIFDWATPEGWMAINDQKETNFHNTSSWLDQKPRLLLEIGVIVGGLLLPLALRYMPKRVPDWIKPITPPNQMAVVAIAYLIVKICDKYQDFSEVSLFGRPSEVTEFYMHYFIALYLVAMLPRKLGAKAK